MQIENFMSWEVFCAAARNPRGADPPVDQFVFVVTVISVRAQVARQPVGPDRADLRFAILLLVQTIDAIEKDLVAIDLGAS